MKTEKDVKAFDEMVAKWGETSGRYRVPLEAKIYVAGHRGLLGSAIIGPCSAGLPQYHRAELIELDLRPRRRCGISDRTAGIRLPRRHKVGIWANMTYRWSSCRTTYI